ncbi:MAG: DUF2007 domain-containing protein [Desulfuromonadales bacterium]
MKKLHTFSPWERPQAELLRELLEKEDVVCVVRNGSLASALGEIPFTECYPELWVVDDEVFPRASMLLSGWLMAAHPAAEPWVCLACGEKLEGQFGACWRCGKAKE